MKNLKKAITLFISLCLVFCLAACGGGSGDNSAETATYSSEEPLVIKLGHTESDNENSTHHTADTKFAELANEYTDGRVQIEVYANGQLGGERDMIEGLQIGTIDMCSVANFSLGSFDPSFGVFDLPYFFESKEDAYKVLDSDYLYDTMAENLASSTGIRILGVGVGGYRQIVTNEPITSLDDLKGKKIRVPENSMYVDAYNALGCQTTTMAISEVITGLQQGTVDGFEMMVTPLYTNGFYDLLSDVCMSNVNFSVNPILISEKLYQTLTAEDQEALKKAAREAGVYEREKIAAFTEEAKGLLEEKGMTFTEVDTTPWKEATAGVIDKYAEKIGTDIIENFRQIMGK